MSLFIWLSAVSLQPYTDQHLSVLTGSVHICNTDKKAYLTHRVSPHYPLWTLFLKLLQTDWFTLTITCLFTHFIHSNSYLHFIFYFPHIDLLHTHFIYNLKLYTPKSRQGAVTKCLSLSLEGLNLQVEAQTDRALTCRPPSCGNTPTQCKNKSSSGGGNTSFHQHRRVKEQWTELSWPPPPPKSTHFNWQLLLPF